MLLGAAAQSRAGCISETEHIVLKWDHPSPLNNFNKSDNPRNFKYCDVFSRANEILSARASAPINWDPSAGALFCNNILCRKINNFDDPMVDCAAKTWVFTDGGAARNGKKNCSASWAYYITNKTCSIRNSGIVENSTCVGSNNRGELTSIMRALGFLEENWQNFCPCDEVIIVTDSMYCINTLDKWVNKWLSDGDMNDKKNLDIILPTKKILDQLRTSASVRFQHIKGHAAEPDCGGEPWFIWRGNDIVDKLCGVELGRGM